MALDGDLCSAALCNDTSVHRSLLSNTNQLPKKDSGMAKKKNTKNPPVVDKGLVAMFLKMSPEARLQANDTAARTIKELRDAYKEQRNDRP